MGAAAAGLLVAVGCGRGGTLTGAGGGGGIMTTGRAGGQAVSGAGGSGVAGAGSVGTGGSGLNACTTPFVAQRVAPDVLIVLDTSASMNDGFDGACAGGCGATSKWAAAVSAIDSVAELNKYTVNWGLALMTSGTGDVCTAGGVAVPLGQGTSTPIADALTRRSNAFALAAPGNTPVRASIPLAMNYLLGLTDTNPKFILLVTDGVPDCKQGEADPLASDGMGAVEAIGNADGAGFPTLVVGLGTMGGPADTTLGEMAVAGGMPRVAAPAYVPAASSGDLTAAMNAFLATPAAACTFAIPEPPTSDGTTFRSQISVLVGGRQIFQNDPNGWDYANTSQETLQLRGTACGDAAAGEAVQIIFRCILP